MQSTIYRLIWYLSWVVLVPIFRIFVKFEAIGKENLKKVKGPVIFISNHESYFDPWIIGMGVSLFNFGLYPIYYMTNDGLFKKKKLRPFLWINGSFPGKAGSGVEESLKRPSQLLKEGKNVGIFPEWCYKNEPEISRIQEVISLLSLKNNVPVVPIFIYGIFDGGMTWKKIFTRGRNVKIVFGEPICPKEGMVLEDFQGMINKSHSHTKTSLIKSFHEKEKKFWSHYAKFYYYLERAQPYSDLIDEINSNLPEVINGKWMDLGSGSGAIVELLNKKTKNHQCEIVATDIEPKMIDHLSHRFEDKKNVQIKEMDLTKSFDFPKNNFDGITANLVLPYLIHHEGEIGSKSFIKILNNIYELLKPGGVFVWSTPKKKVNFLWVFLASWKNILDPRNLSHLYYGPAIFKQALQIQNKGHKEIYHFLDIKEVKKILEDIGFSNITFSRSMAGQVDIIKCEKL